MPLPAWIQQEAYEEYIANEKAFQEWCEKMEEELAAEEEELEISEFYVRTRPKHVRPRRYCHKNK